MSAGGLGEFIADPATRTHGRASSSKGAVFTHPCSTWGMYQFRHTSGTELCQGQTCSPSALASSPPSFHKSSPSLTLSASLQQKHSSPSLSSHPAHRGGWDMLHMLTCSLSFLSVLLQGTQAFFLPHTPFHAPLPSFCHQIPLPSGGSRLPPQHNACSQSPSL